MSRVFGYACLTEPATSATVGRWRTRIATHCTLEGLALELVFIDNGVPEAHARPGWTALLDILGLHDGPHDDPQGRQRLVVVPSLAHLSGDLATLTRMRAQLEHAGATTSIMPRTPPHRRPSTRTGNQPA